MLSKVDSNKPFPETTEESLFEILEHAENYCKDCKPVSPIICVERCDVWKIKNEI